MIFSCFLYQNVKAFGSFIDVDEAIEDKSILAAEKLKSKLGLSIQMKFMNTGMQKKEGLDYEFICRW